MHVNWCWFGGSRCCIDDIGPWRSLKGVGIWWSDPFHDWRQITQLIEYLTRDSGGPGSNPCLVHRHFYWNVTSGMTFSWYLQMSLKIMQFQYYKWFIFQACRTLQSTLSYWTKGRCFLSGSTRRNSVRSWTITKSSCWLVKQAVEKQHRYHIQWLKISEGGGGGIFIIEIRFAFFMSRIGQNYINSKPICIDELVSNLHHLC